MAKVYRWHRHEVDSWQRNTWSISWNSKNFPSTIRFTAEVSNDKHFFLDTTSHLVDDKVVVDLYTKPTDSHQYLLPTSCHPPHQQEYTIQPGTTHQTHLLWRWGLWEKSVISLCTSQQKGLSEAGHWSSHREGQAYRQTEPLVIQTKADSEQSCSAICYDIPPRPSQSQGHCR